MRRPRRLESKVTARRLADRIDIEAPLYRASVRLQGYVSGIAEGSFEDKKSKARDLGFGLDIADFLLEPADPRSPIADGQYTFGPTEPNHGNIPKRYVEGPQICTQAKRLDVKVHEGPDFIALTMSYVWHTPYAPRTKAGSTWTQTLIFPAEGRFILSCDRIEVANESPSLLFRQDLPGHIKHQRGDTFEHVYLSYRDNPTIPSTEFADDFPPDAKFLYRREVDHPPDRMIRGYQVDLGPERGDGPWLAGMTLDPSAVAQAWCHQRGYVCMIQEIGGRPVKPGDFVSAAYLIGWYDDLDSMHASYDRYKGVNRWVLDGPSDHPTSFRGVPTAS